MVRDPAFLEQARRESFDINPVSGEELQRIVAEIVATPKSITDRLQDVIGSVEQTR
jgi:predicted neutral ceramidase superfamily lipid hydrolase